jgi:hypothetical protein
MLTTISEERAREKQFANPYPKITNDLLTGTIQVQWKKCGKPNCKCQRGDLHGPYYYRFWWAEGRLCRQYVKKSDLPAVRRQIQEYHGFQKAIREGNALRKRAMQLLKEYEHLWKP